MTISFAVLGLVVVLFVANRLPLELVAIGGALILYLTGVLDLQQTLAGFGDPTVIFIATLFVVSEGLAAGGVTAWAGRQLVRRAGGGPRRLLLMLIGLAAVTTALISVNGAIAALLPVAVMAAAQTGLRPSRLLLPLVFAAHAGSQLALTGTPVNVIVSDAAADAGAEPFGYFAFALAGVPLLAGTVAIVLLAGHRLIPDRVPRSIPPDFTEHARTLVRQYQRLPAGGPAAPLFSRDTGLAEVVVPPRSGLIGASVFKGMVTSSGTLVVVAVQRHGADLDGDIVLAPGDTLLLEGTWEAFAENLDDPDVLIVDQPDLVRRQAAPIGRPGRTAAAVLGVLLVLLATGVVPPAVAGLLAAGALILLRVLTVPQAYRSISWTTVVLVAAMIPLSTAMQQSGAAGRLAHLLVELVGTGSPYLLVLGLSLLTAVLGQLISNTATALIVIPIALSAAAETGVSVQPLLMAITVSAAASFLTPVATPVNLMVMEPGGYRFGDYWRLGLPLLLLFVAVATLVVPLLWPF